jgi:hypothetical protein
MRRDLGGVSERDERGMREERDKRGKRMSEGGNGEKEKGNKEDRGKSTGRTEKRKMNDPKKKNVLTRDDTSSGSLGGAVIGNGIFSGGQGDVKILDCAYGGQGSVMEVSGT